MTLDDISPNVIYENRPAEPRRAARHGYSILKDVEGMNEGRVVLSTGTLYGALRRLLDDRWLERFEEDESSRDRHAYRLTPKGRENLFLEVARMKQISRLARLRLSPKGA